MTYDHRMNDNALREHVLFLLRGEGAHADFASAVKGMPKELQGRRPDGFPHSAWELLEHIRIAQWDILEYVVDPDHVSPEFPAGYWPQRAAPDGDRAWNASVKAFQSDLDRLAALVADESKDVLAPIAFANNATILRQALLAADHNAYHLGQLVMVRRLLGAWER